MESLKEKFKKYMGGQQYKPLLLIPGTTSYRDIDHEYDVTTSCAQAMTSSCNNDDRYEVRKSDSNSVESVKRQKQTVNKIR